MKITVISGSLTGTKTRITAKTAIKSLKNHEQTADIHLFDLAELTLQFADGRDFRTYEGDHADLITHIMQADALIIATPTYQASIPGALKNIFDCLPPGALRNKTAAILATAGTPKHYLMAQYHLKPVLEYMGATVLPKYVFLEGADIMDAAVINDDVLQRIDFLMEDVIKAVKVTTL